MEEQENDFSNDLFSYELVDDDPKEYSHIYYDFLAKQS